MMRRKYSWATLAFPIVLAGCGGGTAATSGSGSTADSAVELTRVAYTDALREIGMSAPARDADQLFFELAAGEVSAQECRRGSRRFADDVHTILARVDVLNPPVDAADVQRRLLAAGRESAAKLDALADDVEAGKVSCGEEWNERAYGLPSTARAYQALVELEKLGYYYIGQ